MFSPTNTPASNVLSPLKAILEGFTRQHEALKELVAAVQDAERGRSASLASLLAQYSEKSPAEVLSTKTEVCIIPLPLPSLWLSHLQKTQNKDQSELQHKQL